MAEARSRDRWARTSALMALAANCHRDPKKSRPFKPADFDPYSAMRERREAIEVADMGLLKVAFGRGEGQNMRVLTPGKGSRE